jgi:hypothetical protein
MNGFVEGLPWNLSAIGSLVVLVAAMATDVDIWVSLERAGLAFVGFWVIGFMGRMAFRSAASHDGASVKSASTVSKDHERSA